MALVDRTRMRGIRTLALLGCSLLGGCLEIEQTITLQADGSGSQAVRMKVRASTLQEMQRRQPAARLGASGDPFAVFDRDKVAKELVTAGMKLARHEAASEGAWKTAELTATFADFATLKKSPLSGSAAEWQLGNGPKPGLAKLTFYPQGKDAWQKARKKAVAMAASPDPVAEQFFEKQQQALTGLDVIVRLKVPGKVLVWTRNMQKTGDCEVTARIQAAQIKTPEDLVRRLAPRFEVIFDARKTGLLTE